jgi:peptidylprolyl isomerase
MVPLPRSLARAATLALVVTACEEGAPPVAPTPPLATFATPAVEAAAPPSPTGHADALPAPSDVAAPPPDATKTSSGLAYRLLSAGSDPKAPKPGPTSQVTVSYTGWTTDGKMFDSSIPRGEPATFPLDHVIPGWAEGLQLMKVGDKMRFWIPGNLAYDDPRHPARPGTPRGMLVFDVELLSVGAAP